MKNLIIILISSVCISLTSCANDDGMYGPDGTQQPSGGGPQVSGQVIITVSSGNGGPGNGSYPIPALPASGTGWVKLPINIVAPELFYSYQVQPYSFYPITIWLSDTQYITGCVTSQTRSTINTLAFSQGYQNGDWIEITHLMLTTEAGAAPQVIEFIQ